jgi:hypothetical protein
VSEVGESLDADDFKNPIDDTKGHDYALELGRAWSVVLDTEGAEARVTHVTGPNPQHPPITRRKR